MREKIDFVIPWVDGDDEEWKCEKRKYQVAIGEDAIENRYRDWDNLRYWFRGVEKFAPWVNRVHFITWGHVPEWLKLDHPKLHLVKHDDYIPKEYLPVFSANPIELNLHRIKGLEEQFVYFNDDTFLTRDVYPVDFFKNGKPNCMFAMCPYICQRDVFSKLIANDLGIINSHFDKKQVLSKNWRKCFSPKNGWRVLMSVLMAPYPGITGFINAHLPNAFLKSTFEEIWKREYSILDETCKHRFRSPLDVNQHLMKYWQLMQGRYNPISEEKKGHYYSIGKDNKRIYDDIKNQKYKMVCLNDAEEGIDFKKEKEFIKRVFDLLLPTKSEFEK